MSAVIHETYQKAGVLMRTGLGLVMEISGSRYYIPPEEVPALLINEGVEVVNPEGEREGTAWLSPAISEKKQDLTALIRERVFVVRYDEMKRVLLGDRARAPVKEYRPQV